MAPTGWWSHNRLLVRGSRGHDVKALQEALNGWFDDKLKVTGTFDVDTENRVKEFQRLNSLIQDGKVGPFTNSIIFESNYKFSIARPPVVAQTLFLCWAAALESALHSTWIGRKKHKVDDLRKNYSKHLTPRGDITVAGFEQVLKDLRSSGRLFKASDLRIEKILAFLRTHKVQMLIVDDVMGGSVAHTRVVYGAEVRSGLPGLLVMDPLKGLITLDFGVLQGHATKVLLIAPVSLNVMNKDL